MDQIDKIFKVKKPVIGMLHLDYLEGEKFKGIKFVINKALEDIKSLQEGDIDGILIENWKEFSVGEFVSNQTAENFKEVVQKLAKFIKVPFGINVLNNDYKVAFSAAKSSGASFVELDVFVDKVKSNFVNNTNAMESPFVIDPQPGEIWSYAKSIGASDIPLFAFVQPKHYIMLEPKKTIEISTQQAIKNGATAILVTKATGFAPTVDLIKRVKRVAGDTPVGIGSGFNIENAKDFLQVIDFAVVGSSLKVDGITDNPVDPVRVANLMNKVRS
ncbi:MAG: Photosystem I assembly BtpA [Candidatus Amesbacteria bacterium GW2011_GWB1_47_26]|uniref:Photosystem I assembly BtpA n=1 Tax=Candidatus Amesbacteria bacterium GW2011_GWC2_45_19 TaxID=1618366 RepID=A0A0G1M351_9BACT|nr:MAG: Photosystem I assembly BtpA [Candidatus Amesbacteria bacterium GW2011_GWC2_45_19]KKU38103.1 MAG: Photosystem I assembly BtpA [Candidatus Amesbacteria bacterium GW2011_GWA1_46_35]KKU69075.1 MAG: Photosystem I assembly BtpA [Microgenomates group bacterium GW2011_GWC1_47_20]KKU74762.1 MAG: Photosystem I assembly BtpA [Candidatus Amesbacteria bacterium GW2011_GWB1_47_26]KKU80193.1 MAG: Photosystem I assembly BtpA [Candidatus Amesbacteria bacterium GW2011_GWA2_47_70]